MKIRLGAKFVSNHEPFIEKFKFTLSKIGKTTRSFRYDLNKISCDYTVEVTSRFKGLNLIGRVPEELWMEICDIVQEAGIKTIPRKIKAKRQDGCLTRPYR